MEMLAVKSERAECSHRTICKVNEEVEREVVVFDVGDEVWIARGKTFGKAMNRAFETK